MKQAFAIIGLLMAAGLSGQGWPLPSKTPGVSVPCADAPNQRPDCMTVGYTAPIVTFTGRFLDSSNTSEHGRPIRAIRASDVLIRRDLGRIYFRMGNGAVAAYGLERFFQRLEAGEPMTFPLSVPQDRSGMPEVLLPWGSWFNPEVSSGWQFGNRDAYDILMGFDVDDRGLVYVAATILGWGLVKDDLADAQGQMRSQFQDQSYSPDRVIAVRNGAKYYALVSSVAKSGIFDVTDRTRPVKVPAVAPTVRSWAKTSDDQRLAFVDSRGMLIVTTTDRLVSSSTPLFSGGGYSLVTGDGTNFYALKSNQIVPLVPAGDTYVAKGPYPIGATMDVTKIHAGDGFLVMSGFDAGGGWDLRVFKLSPDLVPSELTMNALPAHPLFPSYWRNYYGTGPPSMTPNISYQRPGYVNITDGVVYRTPSGRTYLIVCAKGIGDVYELAGGAPPAPAVIPPVPPPVVLPPPVVPPVIPPVVPPVTPPVTPPGQRTVTGRDFAPGDGGWLTIWGGLGPRTAKGFFSTADGRIVVWWVD